MSTLADLLVINLGARFTKLLVESWLGKGGTTTVIGDVIDVFKGRIQSAADQKKAKREFEELGDRMARELLPLFERAEQRGQVNVEAVVLALELTMSGLTNSRFLVERNLDSGAILAELKQKRPLPSSQLFEAEHELYDRALERSIRQLVEIASRLPQFEESVASRSLQQLSRVTSSLDEILVAVRNIEKTVGAETLDKRAREYEIDYRLAVQRNLDYLEIFGIDLPPEARSQKLSVAYISLNLESRSEESSESLPAEALFDRLGAEKGRLLIRGDAGTGKSTLLRWAALQAAGANETARLLLQNDISDNEAPVESSWRARVPFLIRLRQCKIGSLPRPEDFPELVAQALGGPPSDWVKSVFKNNRALLLLDGIDEIPNAHRETTRRSIIDLVKQYPLAYFIVSTRPRAVVPDWLADLGFFEARINPLSDLDRTRFIARWYEAVGDELKARGKPNKGLTETADALTREFEENPEVARLATNPLLCAMICGLYRERRQKLPERQRQLCEDLCYALLHRRERESGLNLDEFPEPYRRLDYPQKRAAVQELAHHMVLNEYSSISMDEAQDQIGNALKQFPGHSAANARIVIESLVERSGILREETPGQISFIHNAFKELLAGDYFASADAAGLLAKHVLDPSWQPIILFAVATDRRGFATKVIEMILDRGGTVDQTKLRTEQIMALKCRASALYLHEKLELRLQKFSVTLFPPRTMEVAEALASSGNMVVPLLVGRQDLNETEAAATIRALRLIGTPLARQALRPFIEDRRLAVIFELAQAINPLEIKWTQEQLLAGKELPDGIRSQVVDLSPLEELKEVHTLMLHGTGAADISPLAKLQNLKALTLGFTAVTNISPLAALKKLHVLFLTGTRVVDISPLAELENLQTLDLSGTKVADLSPLAELTNLQTLYLTRSPVRGLLAPLEELKSLQHLYLDEEQASGYSPPSGVHLHTVTLR